MSAPAMLEVRDLSAFYGDFQALFGVDLEIASGEIVAIIGSNGAGKSTLLKAVAGLVPARPEAVRFQGQPVGGRPAHEIARLGVALVPEGRRLFPSLTVEENLLIGGHHGRPGPFTLERVLGLFPGLRDRRRAPAPSLSGGQQQMVAIGRALMSNPTLLLCDEMSLGLAPLVIGEIYQALTAVVAQGGLTLVIVEQDVGLAMRVAHRLFCLQEGKVSLAGRCQELTRQQISVAYFGM